MPTVTRHINRIQDCDDYADALSWAGGAVFNEAGVDVDFRVEGIGQANALFVDGANGRVGIGTAAPTVRVDIRGTGDNSQNLLNVLNLDGSGGVKIGTNAGGNGFLKIDSTGGATRFNLDTDGDCYFNPVTGNFGIGTTSPDRLLHAEVSDAVTNTVTYAQRLSHITSGTAAANFATGIEFELEDAGGGMDVAGTIDVFWAAATAGAERGGMRFRVKHTAGMGEGFRFHASGAAVALGFFGTYQLQQPHIVDAANAAGDPPTQAEYNAFVAKFNTLLADLEGYGLLASA